MLVDDAVDLQYVLSVLFGLLSHVDASLVLCLYVRILCVGVVLSFGTCTFKYNLQFFFLRVCPNSPNGKRRMFYIQSTVIVS